MQFEKPPFLKLNQRSTFSVLFILQLKEKAAILDTKNGGNYETDILY